MQVAVVNAGSRTIKAALVGVGTASTTVSTRRVVEITPETDLEAALCDALDALGSPDAIDAVGHRVVHGGKQFTEPARIDAAVEHTIDDLGTLAPLHNPPALAGIRAARERFAGKPMVAVFDTAFHAHRPAESLHYPLPWKIAESLDLLRFGFHGIAHASLAESLSAEEGIAEGQATAVTLQLGAGCSACAVECGRSVETSMGFSPLGGLPMATRPGDLDPAVVIELIRRGHSVDQTAKLLTHDSGLRGLAGAADMRDVLAAESRGDDRAALAIALFVRRIVAVVGGYFTLLAGRGSLVFGGGIGTHSPEIRSRIAAGLSAWDVELDSARNEAGHRGRISRAGTRAVYVFETDEERLIARGVHSLLKPGDHA